MRTIIYEVQCAWETNPSVSPAVPQARPRAAQIGPPHRIFQGKLIQVKNAPCLSAETLIDFLQACDIGHQVFFAQLIERRIHGIENAVKITGIVVEI